MNRHGVVPDVIDVAPNDVVEVKFPSGAQAKSGNELSPNQAKDQPTVSWPAEDGQLYTLAMVDPDAPSRLNPKFREWNHWLVVNIQGTNVSSGQALTEYRGPSPPQGSGQHRYVVLVFKQQGKIQSEEGEADRAKFSIRKFAQKNRLGDPVAGNVFLAKND